MSVYIFLLSWIGLSLAAILDGIIRLFTLGRWGSHLGFHLATYITRLRMVLVFK